VHTDDHDSKRYQIDPDAEGWAEAEKQVLQAAKRGQAKPSVSVVSHKEKKRKAGDTAIELFQKQGQIFDKEVMGGKKKKVKMGRKTKMS
jgi:N-acetyltransferase 10